MSDVTEGLLAMLGGEGAPDTGTRSIRRTGEKRVGRAGESGRGDAGNLRNFGQMGDQKLLAVRRAVVDENNDPEAIDAVGAECARRARARTEES